MQKLKKTESHDSASCDTVGLLAAPPPPPPPPPAPLPAHYHPASHVCSLLLLQTPFVICCCCSDCYDCCAAVQTSSTAWVCFSSQLASSYLRCPTPASICTLWGHAGCQCLLRGSRQTGCVCVCDGLCLTSLCCPPCISSSLLSLHTHTHTHSDPFHRGGGHSSSGRSKDDRRK